MKTILYASFLFCLFATTAFGQSAIVSGEEIMPSVEDMIKSLSGDQGTEASLADSIDDIVETMTKKMQMPTITEKSVRSAVEGKLITEEAAPEVNRENVEAIDRRTQRYSPRLQLDFGVFPLRRIAGKFSGTLRDDDSVNDLQQTNASLTDGIVRRLQMRLKLETVHFEFRNRTVRLTGTVQTQRERELIETMLQMEPGIDSVKNEIAVVETNLTE